MNKQPKHSHLSYHGTDVEVMLGDHVLFKRLIRRNLKGKVVYIPGISPKHPDIEGDSSTQWAIELENGMILLMVYWPEGSQPKNVIVFIERGEPESYPLSKRIY